jgi:mannosyltransferase
MKQAILNSVSRSTRILIVMIAVTVLAFVLRMLGLGDVPPRWDEGWTVAHASLDLGALFAITAADVHPPMFYMLLGGWQSLVGVNLFAARFMAVLVSLPAVPLAYVVARRWGHGSHARNTRLALLSAVLMAWVPLGVYYSAVIRMYALAPTFVLLAIWAGLRLAAPDMRETRGGTIWAIIAFVVGAAGAMLTLYHAVWALAAFGVYAFVMVLTVRRGSLLRRLAPLAIGVVISVAVFLPWGVYAIPQLLGRAAAETSNIAQQYPISYFIKIGVEGLVMSQQTGVLGIPVIALIIVAGAVCAVIGRSLPALGRLLLPLLMIVLTLVGVAVAARNWAFNARMLICAVPALALALAWGLDRIAAMSRPMAGVAIVALIGVYFTTSTSFVYQKSLEVFDPYNPHTYYAHIALTARPTDQVFFNVLSPAGFYALDRKSTDPSWLYALTWDPVIEPRQRWEARITLAADVHPRLWVVLYRGLAGKNGDLRGWLDSTFYPASAMWGEEEVFYGLYGTAHAPATTGIGAGTHWRGVDGFDLELHGSQLPDSVHAGDIIPVALTWRAAAPLKQNLKVFVHAFDANGTLVAQHDAGPLNDLRPMSSLPVGEDVLDHHGLALPLGFSGNVRIIVGLYDPATNQRMRLDDGSDTLELGRLDVVEGYLR